MGSLSDLIRSRMLPAVLAALGVSFVATGLLVYTLDSGRDLFPFAGAGLALASPLDSPEPSTAIEPANSAAPSAFATPSPPISATLSVSPSPAFSPVGSALPSGGTAEPVPTASATAQPSATRVATRVVIPALNIDLPVVRQPSATSYPLCNVAMYIEALSQPGGNGATYLYAHARAGMFLPLLDQSHVNGGRGMLGMLVQVYTSDNLSFLYQIAEVRLHQVTLADALSAQDQQLWLQTSEGPRGTPGKLQVIALPVGNSPASSTEAHPTPQPVVCA